jgi:hypothetical protein
MSIEKKQLPSLFTIQTFTAIFNSAAPSSVKADAFNPTRSAQSPNVAHSNYL